MGKLFIFDMGEVVLEGINTLRCMANRYNIDYAAFRADYDRFDDPLMEGVMESSLYYRHMESVFALPSIKEDLFSLYFTPSVDTYIISLLDRLRARGHRVVLGSNTFKPHYDVVKRMKEAPLSHFDALYASHEIKRVKPNSAFWLYIMEREGYEAKDTIFIDDKRENIEAAEGLGIECYQYLKDREEAEAFFKRYL